MNIDYKRFIEIHDMKRLSPSSWSKKLNIVIIDPDGWDRRPEFFYKDFSKRITLESFIIKVLASTCSCSSFFMNVVDIYYKYQQSYKKEKKHDKGILFKTPRVNKSK